MWRWVIGAAVVTVLAGVAVVYVLLLWLPEQRLIAAEAELEELEATVPRRWDVAAGTRDLTASNLVPTAAALGELEAHLPRPLRELVPPDRLGDHTVDRWKRSEGHPPFALVDAIRDAPELQEALDALAAGDHGAATDATGDQLDEALLWMVARAWADDDDCLTSVVDAIRVGQAVNPVRREVTDSNTHEPAGEREVVFTVEARLAECSLDATPDELRRTIAALERLNDERPFPITRDVELDWARVQLQQQRKDWNDEYPFISDEWYAQQDGVEGTLEHARNDLAYDGPFLDMRAGPDAPHRYPRQAAAARDVQMGIALLVALLQYRDTESLEGQRVPWGGQPIELGEYLEGPCLWARVSMPPAESMVDPYIYLDPLPVIETWRSLEGAAPAHAAD